MRKFSAPHILFYDDNRDLQTSRILSILFEILYKSNHSLRLCHELRFSPIKSDIVCGLKLTFVGRFISECKILKSSPVNSVPSAASHHHLYLGKHCTSVHSQTVNTLLTSGWTAALSGTGRYLQQTCAGSMRGGDASRGWRGVS